MSGAVSRQVRRAEQRRASKPAPGPVAITSPHRMAVRTKGRPYSRMMLADVIPTPFGQPNVFVLRHPTRKTGEKRLSATPDLIATFFPALPQELVGFHLGF